MLAGDRVSGTDADRHEDISHNGNSGFGDDADSAAADLSRVLINAQIAAGYALTLRLRQLWYKIAIDGVALYNRCSWRQRWADSERFRRRSAARARLDLPGGASSDAFTQGGPC